MTAPGGARATCMKLGLADHRHPGRTQPARSCSPQVRPARLEGVPAASSSPGGNSSQLTSRLTSPPQEARHRGQVTINNGLLDPSSWG
eukprot:771501-Heterocapsa_arctica.AAC.1